jgi:hypothetical protein
MAGTEDEVKVGGEQTPDLESAHHTEEQVQEIDYEAEARVMGWRPEEEFRGDKSRFVDAKTFYERGQEVLPIVKAQNKALKRELDDIKLTLREFKTHHESVRERAFADAMATLRKMRSDAVERGDGAAFDQIDAEMGKMAQERQKEQARAVDAPDPGFLGWVEKNPWYQKDVAMTAAADKLGEQYRAMYPTVSGEKILELVDVDMRQGGRRQKLRRSAR